VLGTVGVARLAYRAPGQANLHPGDGLLNLPTEKHSHGLRALAAIEDSRGSFDGAVAAIERATDQQLGKRQVEGLAALRPTTAKAAATTNPKTGDPAVQRGETQPQTDGRGRHRV
jgi:hypothetical protein